jgi:hypothetical protein
MNSKLKEVVDKIKACDKTVDEKIIDLFMLSEKAWRAGAINDYTELANEIVELNSKSKENSQGFDRFLATERIGKINFQLPDVDFDDLNKLKSLKVKSKND